MSALIANLALVLAEGVGGGDAEAHRLRGDRVHQRPALHAREERAVDRLRVLLGAEHEPGARAGERLVRRRGDEVRVRHRARMQPRRDQAREMGHIGHQHRPHLVGDLAEPVGLDRPRVGRAAADDQLRPNLLGLREHLVVVDHHRLARDAVVMELVELPGEIHFQSMCQMTAVIQREPEHPVARLKHGEVHRHVRLSSRVRLDVRVLGPEQRLGAVAGQLLHLVDDLAAAVVALPRVTLGVLVRRCRADRLEHRRPREVLRRDQLDLTALPFELPAEGVGDLGVDVGETRRP